MKILKDYFIPHAGNKYKPDSLQTLSLGVMGFLILLSFAVANIHALLWISSDWLVSTILPAVIVELTNEERDDDALGSLRRSATLDEAARLKAEDMAAKGYFAHYAPDGTSPWYWFDEAGYAFIHAGENLAVHFTDSDEVVEAWMDSPGHRANIMNGNYTEIGVGTAEGEYNGYPTVFVVQLFGTPAEPGSQVASAETTTQPEDITIEILTESTESAPSEEPVTVSSGSGSAASPQPTEEIAPVRIETVEPNVEEVSPLEEPTVAEMPEDVVVTEPPPPLEDPVVTEAPVVSDTLSLYSDFATTSRDGVPLVFDSNTGSETGITHAGSTNIFAKTATQPHVWLQMVYSVLALFVAVSLTFSIVIEWKKQHPVQIAYGSGLLAGMALLYYVHTVVTSGVTIL